GRFGVLGDAVGVVTMLGDGERDALPGRARQDAAAKLRAHPRVGPEHRGGAGEHADELGDRASSRLDALEQGSALVRGRQLVVDVESAYCCFDCHLASPLSAPNTANSALQSLYLAFTLL